MSEESAVWVLECKRVMDMKEHCPAVKYTGPMDRNSLARYFNVRDLPAIVSMICCLVLYTIVDASVFLLHITIEEINMDSKKQSDQLNPAHVARNKEKYKRK